jgi:hypothetical protein
MPYKFGEYVSTYVDPQSVKISETLRDRFVQNFQANDQLAMAVDQLQAASMFESDVQRKKELQRLTENELAKLAEQGNYENLGMAISKQTKDYVQAKAPIEQNYKAVQSFLGDFSKGLEKGDYTPEQQKYLSDYMLRTGTGDRYKGFEIDPATGKPAEGSMWKAPTLYKDPKIMDKISKAAGMLHERKTGRTVERVAQGEGGMYATEQGGTLSKIDQTDIDAAWAAVLAEPGTKAYFDQIADMQANSYQMNGQLPQVMNAQIQGYTDAINQLNTALGTSRNSSERSQIKAQLQSYTQELNAAKEASADPNQSYAYIKSKSVEQQLKPFKDLLDAKGGIYEQTSVDRVKYDQKKLNEIDRIEKWKLDNPGMETNNTVTADMWGGKDVTEKNTNIRENITQAEKLETFANMTGVDADTKAKLMTQAKALRQNATIIQQQIVSAANLAITEKDITSGTPEGKKIYDTMKALHPWAKPGDIYLKLQQTFDNTGDQDYMDFQNKYKELHGSELNVGGKANAYDMRMISAGGQSGVMYGTPGGAGVLPVDELGVIRSYLSNLDSKVNSGIKEIKTSSVGYSGRMPAATDEEAVMATNAFKAYFKEGFVLGENELVTLADGTQVNGGDLAGFQSTGEYEYLPDLGAPGGEGSTRLKMVRTVDGKSEIKTVYFDNAQATSPALKTYMNSPQRKIATLIDKMNTRSGQETGIELNTDPASSTPEFKMIVKTGPGDKPYVKFTSLDGSTSTDFMGLDSKNFLGSPADKIDGWLWVGKYLP